MTDYNDKEQGTNPLTYVPKSVKPRRIIPFPLKLGFKVGDEGLPHLRPNLEYVADLFDCIVTNSLIEKKPFFALRELRGIERELGIIENSPFCFNAGDRCHIYAEVDSYQSIVDRLRKDAVSLTLV